ncbi:response regulator transcription factor [Clostridium gasigenes]|uniref:Stage 0 sporulation protein A homolog n=1 Tax=Clostridium gasigenes TaxID=94869 RepID=A0A7X0VQJ3_9CLOT|nr:response regulator transcription factor [Clostridium gasigenes]MBB6714422.1 response regulator transcription factor [Clostridium gasigenes]
MRILIIEDDKELASVVKRGLEEFGFSSDIANTGQDGEEKIFVNEYDSILLDLNLPDKDGLEVLKSIRETGITTPVIIITARNEVKERAMGLDLGSDDYIVKPFDLIELRARINAVVRRFYGRVNSEIKIGELLINPKTRVVSYKLKEVKFSAKEFDILEYIANNHPSVVSSESITEHVYDEFFDQFSSVLRVHIANLRKKLKIGAEKDILITLKGKGYRIWEKD